ncbi:hypothetical protein ESZ50_05495 [Weissella muntiaci]|uniref:Uncharacterized protein n=1 Tax=Weissella muntiaci TaxID=2508881 RepID=A0A6C2C7P0_9LACO|nr:hypothetical protein ESZ50_05495 [Weissella muntiaci]
MNRIIDWAVATLFILGLILTLLGINNTWFMIVVDVIGIAWVTFRYRESSRRGILLTLGILLALQLILQVIEVVG